METITEVQKILTSEGGQLRLGGQPIPDSQAQQLKSEAELLIRTSIWPILIETVRAKAIDLGINRSDTFEHVLTAKAMLIMTDWMKKSVEEIGKLPIQNKK